MTQTPPMKSDTARPVSEFECDPSWLFSLERQTRFAVTPIPENMWICARKVAPDGTRLRTLTIPAPRGVAITMRHEKGPELGRLLGLKAADAEARVQRLNMPQRPDGFHLWS